MCPPADVTLVAPAPLPAVAAGRPCIKADCPRPAVIRLVAGTLLCQTCFLEQVTHHFKVGMRGRLAVSSRDSLLVAWSGGQASTATLDMCATSVLDAVKLRGNFQLAAVHVDDSMLFPHLVSPAEVRGGDSCSVGFGLRVVFVFCCFAVLFIFCRVCLGVVPAWHHSARPTSVPCAPLPLVSPCPSPSCRCPSLCVMPHWQRTSPPPNRPPTTPPTTRRWAPAQRTWRKLRGCKRLFRACRQPRNAPMSFNNLSCSWSRCGRNTRAPTALCWVRVVLVVIVMLFRVRVSGFLSLLHILVCLFSHSMNFRTPGLISSLSLSLSLLLVLPRYLCQPSRRAHSHSHGAGTRSFSGAGCCR